MVADNILDLSFLVPLGLQETIPLIMSGVKHLSLLTATVDYNYQSYVEDSDSVISIWGDYDRAEAWMANALSLAQPNYLNDDPNDVEVKKINERWLNDDCLP